MKKKAVWVQSSDYSDVFAVRSTFWEYWSKITSLKLFKQLKKGVKKSSLNVEQKASTNETLKE